jgi:hypothetical protein
MSQPQSVTGLKTVESTAGEGRTIARVMAERHPVPVRFYMVVNTEKSAPKVRHASYFEAFQEAERLAKANPGQEFYVLAAQAIVTSEVVVGSALLG